MRYLFLLLITVIALTSCKKEKKSDSDDEANFSYGEKNFGASADDLLQARKFPSLIVEIQYMEGYEPDEAAILNLKQFVQEHLHKPHGILFIQKQIQAVTDSILTNKQVDSIQKADRTVLSRNGQIALYILYTNGHYENKNVLGHAFKNTCIVIYGKAIKQHQAVFSFPTQTTLESTILLHELGHLLGLVNKGSPMKVDHADTAHDSHCLNPDCVMYWSMSLVPTFGPLKGDAIPCFDSACLQDLKAAGGR
jgi:hypothetical protein